MSVLAYTSNVLINPRCMICDVGLLLRRFSNTNNGKDNTMDEDKLEQEQEPTQEPEQEPEKERYANDDEIEMLRKLESLINGMIDKVDAITSMLVEMDSGSVVDEAVEEVAEESIDDVLDLDDIDLSL